MTAARPLPAPSPARPEGVPDTPPWTTHPNELDLLFACARSDARATAADIRRLAAADLDWSFVVDESRTQGIDAMVYHHLARLAPEALPPSVRATLKQRSEGLLAVNLHRLRVLQQVVAALDAADVPVLTFKGPLLAQAYYGNLGFRRFVDVDLLVPRPALPAAATVLREHGFVPPAPRTAPETARMVEAQLGLEFVRPDDEVWIELHWALLNKTFAFPLATADVFARAQPHEVGRRRVWGLCDEDLLLYLCAHGTKHHWATLRWICDVAQVCRTGTVDWAVLLQRARALDCDRMLALGLLLAGRWLDAPVPAAVQERLIGRDATVARLARHVETRWLFTDAGFDRTPRWAQLRFFLRARRRWAHRRPLLGEYARLALTPTAKDRAFCPLPPSLSGLYYAVRPVRLLAEAVRPRTRPTAAGR
jgi:hypothetical protein